jgi:hypothetical protein
MRFRFDCLTASVALLAVAAPLSAQAFEGRIAFKVSGEDGSSRDMEYQVKDGKLRFEAPGGRGGGMAIVIDQKNQKMLMMMSAQKTYMERPFTPPTPDKVGAGAHATITATGKKETVAGYSCEHFIVTDDDGKSVDACLAHGLGTFMSPPSGNPMGGAAANNRDWTSKIGSDAFPLKVTKGNTPILEVTKIEKASLDASLFAPPDGWRKFDMPNIPGMRPPPQQ